MNQVALWQKLHRIVFWVACVIVSLLVVVLLAVGLVYDWPLRSSSLIKVTVQKMTYTQAVAAAKAQQAVDAQAGVVQNCGTSLYTHGSPTAGAIVMFHGVGACPSQMAGLAQYFFARGYNVYVARWPWHGLPDNKLHAKVTAQELVATTNQSVNIASGLGAEVGAIGLSGGAVMATWAAQYRPDTIRRVLMLSPFYEPSSTEAPVWQRKPLAVLYGYGLLPDKFTAGDAGTLSYHALAQFDRITANLTKSRTNPQLISVGVALSSTDTAIDHSLAISIPRQLANTDGSVFNSWVSPVSWDLGHDIVSSGSNPDLKGRAQQVYPIYFKLYQGLSPE